MTKSILQDKKECWVCGSRYGLHKHHIFYGTANRQISEKQGFWVWLSPEWHNMSNKGVHFNKVLDFNLKTACQAKYEETHSREEFIKLIGRSYL